AQDSDDDAEIKCLPEFTLHHNFLGEQFMSLLGNVLRNDKFCRCIDLRNNLLPSLDEEFLGCLFGNDTIVNLDLRQNQNIDQD
ncbi:MAG: hypothetical protein ACK56I_24230, partial [bacterium]